ncbi:efflux RND transporter periplasmic adaptor subunit [Kordiimonas pumila]|uniref:Efflux RND transporter periplasmic adaptor subunit n=1 Tax=Kordiimonas pumila TaxID=2161677 RepID=A0ABV7D070_9PROT|nr:efflux RND transporter periplasmic adaptor subunit [Kordiimonas pumila]
MKKVTTVIYLALFTAAALGGWWYYSAQQTSANMMLAQTTPVRIGTLESVVTAQGTLEPKNYVDVGAQVSGLIEKMHAEIGDMVKEGDLIAEIDPDVYDSKVRADEARLKTLLAQKTEQEALVKQAQQKFDRNKRIYKENAVSKEVLEDSETTFEIAKANLMSIEAQMEEAQSTLEGDKTSLSYTKIFAPINGTVVDQSVQEGQTINANQTTPTIVQVANLDIMTVRAQVAEADIMKLHDDMPMYFTTLGSGERRWQGKIRQILPTPETVNDVVLYNVLVDVENHDRTLMTGMTTQMFFVLVSAKNVPVIPVSALQARVPEKDTETAKAYSVEVVTPNGTERRTVLVSLADRTQAVIESGLTVGDNVQLKTAGSSAATSGRPPKMARL